MEQIQVFITELKTPLAATNSLALHTLYAPVVGASAIVLYELLIDLHLTNRKLRSFDSIELLLAFLQCSRPVLDEYLKKLEAVGLLRRFARSDGLALILAIQEPLSPVQFKANQFLYRAALSQIGELAFERSFFGVQEAKLVKDDYVEVTTKFHDLFAIKAASEVTPSLLTSTLELPALVPASKVAAMQSLSSAQFIMFLTNQRINATQLGALNRALQLGFATPTLNLVIDYVFNQNRRFVSAHFETIVKDLFTKGSRGFDEVQAELMAAAAAKAKLPAAVPSLTSEAEALMSETADSWDQLFNSLGGEL